MADIKVTSVSIPPIQGAESEQPRILSTGATIIPSAQGPDNEPEDNIEIPEVTIPETRPVADEPDRATAIPAVTAPPIQGPDNEPGISLAVTPVTAPSVQGPESEPFQKTIIPLSGKLVTAEDPLVVGKNFRTLINMRYGDKSPKSIPGMTKINSSIMDATYFKTRNAFHFRKIQPAEATPVETHVLAQAWNTGLTTAHVLQNLTAPPAAGDFEATDLWTDTAGAGTGVFSDAPNGQVAYCNGIDTCLWGGNGIPVSRFLNYDSAQTFLYDHTESLSNSTQTAVTLVADAAGGGANANNALLLHLDNNVTDSGPNVHAVTNNNVTFTTSSKFGTHAAVFNGSTAYLTTPDHADFDFSDGTWTVDFWAVFGANQDHPLYYQETPVTKIIFSAGNHEVVATDTVTQASSGATGTVLSVSVSSGSWAGGDAAGTIWLGSVTGTWTNGNAMIETTDLLSGDGAFTGAATNWTLAAGWTYAANAVNKDGDGTGTLAHDTLAAVSGEVYNVTYTISNLTVGNVTASFGGASGAVRSANDTYTETLTAVSTAGLAFTPSNTARFTIDTIDVKRVPLTCATCTLDKNYFSVHITYNEATSSDSCIVTMRMYGTSTDIITATGNLFGTTWNGGFVEFSENGNNWYVFLNGNLIATAASAERPENYTSPVYIGFNNDAGYFEGSLDELRVSKACRHTASFAPPVAAYSSSTDIAKIYIQTPRPAQGFKFYVLTANTAAATAAGNVWDGSAYSALSLTDGTAVTGKTLAQIGSITFASTVGTAKMKYLDGTLGYTYEFSFSGIDSATSIYHVTAECPFQQITDIWDGIGRYIGKFYLYKTNYEDYTVNVFEDRYDSSDPTTFVELDGLTTAQQVEIGFFEKQTAISITLPAGHVNTTANTVATVYSWTGSAYTTVSTITDGTAEGSIALSKPGTVSWDPPTSEQKKVINNGIPQYFYKIAWNQTLSADVQISYVYGIPAQAEIRGYKFPIHGQERLLLCNNTDEERNSILYAADGTAQIFNGTDSGKLYFGDNTDLNCACNIFAQFAQSLYNITLIFKDNETWGLIRDSGGWLKYRVSDTIGCNAPKTLKTAVIPPVAGDKSGNRNVAIWLRATDGVYVSDGRHPVLVSEDIKNLFDQNSPEHINLSYANHAAAWVDQANLEYHVVFAVTTGAVTTNDVEWVLDLKKWQWYQAKNRNLQCGITVLDSYGNPYTYGFIDTGYMERLEYGNTFDGTAIVSMYQLGDFPLVENDFLAETRVRKIIPAMRTKTTSTDAKLTHFIDGGEEILTLDVAAGTPWAVNDTITGNTSGTTCKIVKIYTTLIFSVKERTGDFTLGEVLTNGTYTADQGAGYPTITGVTDYVADPTLSYYRITLPVKDANSAPGILHSFKEVAKISDETVGLEPLYLGIYYESVREHLS